MIILVSFPGKEPPSIVFRQNLKVMASSKPMDRSFFDAIIEGFKKIDKKKFRAPKYRGTLEGMVISVKKADLDEMTRTLNDWGGFLLSQAKDESSSYIMRIFRQTSDDINKEVFDAVGTAAAQHMRRMAYKLPVERRGGPPRAHVVGKSLQDTDPDKRSTWFVGGRPGQFRTKNLWNSIWYKVKFKHERGVSPSGRKFSKDFVKRVSRKMQKQIKHDQQLVTELMIGPGAGSVPAPHYAGMVNYGAGPVKGMFYLPKFRNADSGQGRMIKKKRGKKGGGGAKPTDRWWGGYEGKFYLEETAEWLVRKTPAMQLRASKFARIYLRQAVREYMSTHGTILLSDEALMQLEESAEAWLMQSASMSTKQMMFQLSSEIMMFAGRLGSGKLGR